MKDHKLFLVAILVAGALGAYGSYLLHTDQIPQMTEVDDTEVYFSPKGGCTDAIVNAITDARSTIFVQAYSFTSEPIEHALMLAHAHGVKVHVILDRSQYDGKGTLALQLYNAGIDVRIDSKHQIAHNKVFIIDGKIVITGSFNATRQAETSNAENLVIMHKPQKAKVYEENWNLHYGHSEPFTPR